MRVTARPGRFHTAEMSTVGLAAGPRAPESRVVIGSAGVALGVALVLIGVALPWMTLQHGQRSVNGVLGDGAYLATAAIGAAALWTAYLLNGRPGPLRALAAGAGFLIVYWTIFDIERIVSVVSDDDPINTVLLAIMAAGLRVDRVHGASGAISPTADTGAASIPPPNRNSGSKRCKIQ